MDTTIFIEIDEKMQNTDMALDQLLQMKLPNEAKDAINMIIENLTAMIPMLSTIKENYLQIDMTNNKLNNIVNEAKKRFREIDLGE